MAPLADLSGTTVVVTGASSGIGRAGALALAGLGATVVVVGRDPERTRAVATAAGPGAVAMTADFAVLADVRRLAAALAESHPRIDVLVNNAGFIAEKRDTTVDGIEQTLAVNHVATHLLTVLLLPQLRAAGSGRVVTTSSDAHRNNRWDLQDLQLTSGWTGWRAYGNSKLANILFTEELARRTAGTGVTATCFHPGVVHTGFGRDRRFLALGQRLLGRFALLTPEAGADTMVWLASSPDVAGDSGGYYVKRVRTTPRPPAGDPAVARALWEQTDGWAGLA